MNLTEFQQKISTVDKPIVIDFWATWCMPCRVTRPILEKLAVEYSGQVEFLAVDADSSPDVLEHFRIAGIPTVITIRNGNVTGRVTGARNETAFRVMFESLAVGGQVKIPMSGFDRMLRLGAGGLLIAAAVPSGNWTLAGIGGIVAFLGMYDRCPIWRAITGLIRRTIIPASE